MGATWRLRHSGKVEIEVVGALADAIAADERRWSRFIARSEVSRLNRAPGVPLQVSTETLDLLLSCDRWHEQTDGAFSVMVGGALIEYGYRESKRVRPPRTSRTPRPAPIPGALVVVDAVRRLACVPEGTALDLGGVARMWSAERAAAMVRTLSDDPAILLEVGDDMVAVRGDHLVAVSGADSDSRRPGRRPARRPRPRKLVLERADLVERRRRGRPPPHRPGHGRTRGAGERRRDRERRRRGRRTRNGPGRTPRAGLAPDDLRDGPHRPGRAPHRPLGSRSGLTAR